MGYTDMSAVWDYQDLVQWKEMDRHAENSHVVYTALNNRSFSAVQTSAQSIPHNTWTKVNFDTEEFDVGSAFDLTNDRWTPGLTGKYLITGYVEINQTNLFARTMVAIYKNGAEFKRGMDIRDNDITAGWFAGARAAAVVNVAAVTDYFELFCYNSNGSAAARSTTPAGGSSQIYFMGSRYF